MTVFSPTGERIARRFAALRAAGRGGLVTFISAGDPDPATSAAVLRGLPGAGADVIELGMPFTDPMADGPSIQAAGLRALKAGTTLAGVLAMVRDFRLGDVDTPVILMGYFNPIHAYGVDGFVHDAQAAGVDGLIIVDLPPEEDEALAPPARNAGLDLVRLVAPTTGDGRLTEVLRHASGFVYYVSIAGITGAAAAPEAAVAAAVERLRRHTTLPIAVGFGIKTPERAAAVARMADGAVVGTAIVDRIASGLDEMGHAKPGLVDDVLGFVSDLANGVRASNGA